MARLGFCHLDDEPSVDCLARYADLFKDPLPPSSIDVLTKLFALEPFASAAPTVLAYRGRGLSIVGVCLSDVDKLLQS